MDDIYRTDQLSTGMGENYVICIAPINKWNPISRSDKVRLLVNQLISQIYPLIVARSLRHHLWTCLHRSGSVSRWQRRTMPLLFATRAATNDYFDNRLVGRLLFRLIGFKKKNVLTKYTLFPILLNVLQTHGMLWKHTGLNLLNHLS